MIKPALPLLLLASVASADPHPMTGGGNPQPTTSSEIAMTREVLTVDVNFRAARVKAAVTLVNRGGPTKIGVAFPCYTGDDAGMIGVPCSTKLKVTVGGKKQKLWQKRKTTKSERHWVWIMKFAEGESADVVVSYSTPLLNDRYSVPIHGMGVFTYRLATGARWAGPIGDLEMTVNLPFDSLIYVTPGGYTREPGRLTWKLKDHEPTEDVVIFPEPRLAGMEVSLLGGKNLSQLQKRRDAGKFSKAKVLEIVKELRQSEERPYLEYIARKVGVPMPEPEKLKATAEESATLLEALAERGTK